jgi:hypothetical protein
VGSIGRSKLIRNCGPFFVPVLRFQSYASAAIFAIAAHRHFFVGRGVRGRPMNGGNESHDPFASLACIVRR